MPRSPALRLTKSFTSSQNGASPLGAPSLDLSPTANLTPPASSTPQQETPSEKIFASREFPHEILSMIFELNANMDDDPPIMDDAKFGGSETRALFETWKATRVCKYWKNALYDMPLIWAGLIDLNVLSRIVPPKNHEKWEEAWALVNQIFALTQGKPLYVRGRVNSSSPRTEEFFRWFLREHWAKSKSEKEKKVTNLKKIDVIVSGDFIFKYGWLRLWNDALVQPQPALVSFALSHVLSFQTLPWFESETDPREDQVLFSNQAPLLREFFTHQIAFAHTAPWISQLVSLDIGYIEGLPFRSLSDVLDMLSNMHSLECLRFSHSRISKGEPGMTITHPLPNITLPKLRNINLDEFDVVCFWLLQCVTPHLECCLVVRTSKASLPIDHGMMPAWCGIVSSYLRRYLTKRPEATFKVIVSPGSSIIHSDAWGDDCERELFIYSGYFIRDVTLEDLQLQPLNLLDAIPAEVLPLIGALTLKTFLTLNASLINFIQALPSIYTLNITGDSFRHLQSATPLVFPSLKRIAFESVAVADNVTFSSSLKNFLEHRQEMTSALQEIDITEITQRSDGARRNWYRLKDDGFLESQVGLKVKWGDGAAEYICGIGKNRGEVSESGNTTPTHSRVHYPSTFYQSGSQETEVGSQSTEESSQSTVYPSSQSFVDSQCSQEG